MIGVVKMFKSREGYGFITLKNPIGELKDVFFHISEVNDDQTIEPGWTVDFKLSQNRRDSSKTIAVDIHVTSRVTANPRIVEVPKFTLQTLLDTVESLEDLRPDEMRAVDEVRKLLGGNVRSGDDSYYEDDGEENEQPSDEAAAS